MTKQEFISGVENISGCRIAHITTYTDEVLPKKLGLGAVTKRTSVAVQVNFDYEKAVNNRLEKEGKARTFSANGLPWGTWKVFNKTINHNGATYLRYYDLKGAVPNIEWYVDGRPMTDTEFAIMMAHKDSKKKGSAKQSAEGLNNNQVSPRVVNIDNIESFKCGEIDYNVTVRVAG